MKYTSTIIFTAAVITIYGFCAAYVKKCKTNGDLTKKRRWIEQLPSLVSTTGVLGTFLGITIGLVGFDTQDIAGSIPTLLAGLSTAFFTSLAGMIGSLLLSRQVNAAYDDVEQGVTDVAGAAASVVAAVQTLVTAQQQGAAATQTTLAAMQSSLDTLAQGAAQQVSQQTFDAFVSQCHQAQTALQSAVDNQLLPKVKRLDGNVGELLDVGSATTSQLDEMSDKVSKLTDKLHNEVLDIEDSMAKTNNLLTEKFSEFSDLLKKSNTEALVEVMKRVTEEFQKQMGDLIGRLVQENFSQLNHSVEQLNGWQTENKAMIAELTQQYHQMAADFGTASTTLTQVGADTEQLAGNGGKLHQLVAALGKVMVDDKRFVEIGTTLSTTANLTKENMQMFTDATAELNQWVRKQRGFVDSVALLMAKLDDISKINDYSDVFWKETKQGLNDAAGMVRGAADQLNKELGDMDAHFYNRLSATLSELDSCIQAMVQGRG